MSFIDPLYFVFLATGFSVGFGHCIGMCGPIVVSLALHQRENASPAPHFYYQMGRISTYAALGALMGFSGSFAGVAARLADLQKGVLIASGLFICLMGISMGGWLRFRRPLGNSYRPQGLFASGFKRIASNRSPFSYFPLGLFFGFLPCGPVYTALVAAAGVGVQAPDVTQGAVAGAGLMLCFGLGTLPALFAVAKLSDLGWLKKKALIYKIGAIFMVATGIFIVFKGIRY